MAMGNLVENAERHGIIFLALRPVVRLFYRSPFFGRHIQKLVALLRYVVSPRNKIGPWVRKLDVEFHEGARHHGQVSAPQNIRSKLGQGRGNRLKIKYVCPIHDASGYAAAARMYIVGLIDAGVEITIKDSSFEGKKDGLGAEWARLTELIGRELDYDTVVVHLTPNNYPLHAEEGKRNIGITVWETSAISEDWVPCCNMMDGVIVPCAQNVSAFASAGVTVPIVVVPYAIEVPEGAGPASLPGTEGLYRFYSIFQWTERKNPAGLLKAYFAEFSPDEPVCLVLKTYIDFLQPIRKQKREIARAVDMVRRNANFQGAPPVYLVVKRMSKEEVFALHAACDCFVLAHRGEGFGLPIAEAMALGKPAIATTFGGPEDFMKPAYSMPVGYSLTPTSGMPWIEHYNGKQWWAEPDLKAFSACMRRAYADREWSAEMGRRAAIEMKAYGKAEVGLKLREVIEAVGRP